MSSSSLTAWLRETAAQDALLSAWHRATDQPTSLVENVALAAAGLASKNRITAAIAVPGGHCRLPLLTAAHQAALHLHGFPSPLSPRTRGPAALVTRRVVRRDELAVLKATDVPIWPALHPVRLRADGLVAPLHGGSAQLQGRSSALLFVGPAAGWALPTISPGTVVVDGVGESADFVEAALAWAEACGASAVLFVDAARRDWPADALVYPAGWAAILAAAADSPPDPLTELAAVRGHAAVMAAGSQHDLASAAKTLMDARRHGPLPPKLLEAAVVLRRLGELVVPIKTYDAACPRWHTSTLSERLEDLSSVRASDFPRGWRIWAETCWATVKEGIVSASAELRRDNQKMTLLVEAVDADLRAGLTVDIALSSRIARDAVIRHLANTGVPYLMNGQLVVRSLADTPVGSAPPRATVLAAPPIARLSHRIVSADVGPLNVLCYDHEIAGLRSTLRGSLDEPLSPLGAVKLLLPPNLDLLPGPSGVRPAVIISVSKSSPTAVGSSISLSHFADAADIAGLAALATDSGDPIDLPDDELVGQDELNTATNQNRITTTLSAAVPMTVSPVGRDSISSVHIPVDASVLRILAGRMSRIPTLEVLPGMLLADLNGVTPFDRLRPLLLEARGPATRMLLTAWEQALSEALHRCGGPSGLSRSLSDRGTSITTSAVEGWSDPDRIGPRKPVHVEQVGQIAEHPIVRDHASAVAQVMHELRKLHQAVGQALAAPNGLTTVANDLEHLLGPDAASAVAETVVYRVLHIDTARDVDRSQHYVLQPFIATDPAREGHS